MVSAPVQGDQIRLFADLRCLWSQAPWQIKRKAASALFLSVLFCHTQAVICRCLEFQLHSLCTSCRHSKSLLKPSSWAEQHISILSRNSFTRNDIPDLGIFIAQICRRFVFKSEEQVTNSINKSRNRKKQFAKKEADGLGFVLLNSCFNSLLFLFCMREKVSLLLLRALCTRRCTVTD